MGKYPCRLSESGTCKYGRNKVYNYGFVSGTSGYCRLKKEWISNMRECPAKEKKED